MEFINSYLSTQFAVYLIRWILSGVVMIVPLYFLIKWDCCNFGDKYKKYQEYFHLIVVQIIGAFIFYHIDQIIFK